MILRAIKRVDVDTGAVPLRVVGVDDWAWKKGQTCGTILVDLERRDQVSWNYFRIDRQPQYVRMITFRES